MRLSAGLALLLALPSWGQDGGLALAVDSALLRRSGVELEVGPGVYLPAELAVTSAQELAACRASGCSSAPQVAPVPPLTVATWLLLGGLVVGLTGGVVLGWWARSQVR